MKLNDIQAIDERHFMPVFGKRFPVAFERGEGAHLIDVEGRRYLDMFAGIAVNALGYSDEGLKAALHGQVDAVLHTSSLYYIENQARAAEAVCRAAGYDRCFFGNSGAEANEGAMKLVRKYFYNKGENRYAFICMESSFHGRTLGTLNVTGQEHYRAPFYPLPPEAKLVPFGDIDAVRAAIDDTVCGIIVEPILCEGGILTPPEGYLQELRRICDENGLLLIFDEVQTGMGRTGSFLCSQKYGVRADVVTLAKALGGGVPIGAFLADEEVAQAFVPGDHGSTFGGNQLATAAALYVTERVSDPALLEAVEQKGLYLNAGLKAVAERYPDAVKDVRGEGLIQAVQLAPEVPAGDVVRAMLAKGVLAGTAKGNVLRLLPPYVVTEAEIDTALSALSEALSELTA